MNNIENNRLEQILSQASGQLNTLMMERSSDIQNAWNETIEEAQENEKEKLPPLKLSMSVVVDLEKDVVESALRFTCAYTSKLCATLPDPNQPTLPI